MNDHPAPGRRRLLAGAAAAAIAGPAVAQPWPADGKVNAERKWPAVPFGRPLQAEVDVGNVEHAVDRRLFGSNLEWFNDAGGLADPRRLPNLVQLAREQGASVFRFPGGILADYYDWKDGIGPANRRPRRRHPTDPGESSNAFGSPEFFRFLQATGSEALMTVNVGTGTAEQAADWVAYCNAPNDARRRADGFPDPVNVKLWEVGNELYLPGNPYEKKIGTTPEVYAERFVGFADAMRKVDPSITVVGIGVARSHLGPDSDYPDWSDKLLQRAADRMDMLAVHNAYYPLLYRANQAPVDVVYPALWAAPEAVDKALTKLSQLIARHERGRHIKMAITEWGMLFTSPRADPYWVDHVKTLGSAVYVARMLQVLMSQPRMAMANYFKFTDRSFMGWVDLQGRPKVPYHALRLYARFTGSHKVRSQLEAVPTYDAPAVGVMGAERGVPDVTLFASRDQAGGKLYVNLVNRSMTRLHTVDLRLRGMTAAPRAELVSLSGAEPTAHNGRDIPPEWPYKPEYDPYTSHAAGSIDLQRRPWSPATPVQLPPFSVATLVINDARSAG